MIENIVSGVSKSAKFLRKSIAIAEKRVSLDSSPKERFVEYKNPAFDATRIVSEASQEATKPKVKLSKKVAMALAKGVGYTFSPMVGDVLIITAAGLAVVSNPVGLGFGVAAASVMIGKLTYDSVRDIEALRMRSKNDLILSKLAAIADIENQIKEIAAENGFKKQELIGAGLLGEKYDIAEEEKEPVTKKPGLLKKAKIFAKSLVKQGSTASFSIAASAATLSPLSLTSSVSSYLISSLSNAKSSLKTSQNKKLFKAVIAMHYAELGIKSDDDLDAVLAKRIATLRSVASASTIEELKDQTMRKEINVANELKESLPKPLKFMEAAKEYLYSRTTIQRSIASKKFADSTMDEGLKAGLEKLDVVVAIDSYKDIKEHNDKTKSSEKGAKLTTGPKMVAVVLSKTETPKAETSFVHKAGSVISSLFSRGAGEAMTTGPRFAKVAAPESVKAELAERAKIPTTTAPIISISQTKITH